MRTAPTTKPARERGVVLLITLVLIVIAAVVLAATARRSMTKALDAKRACDDLEKRWAVTSVESALYRSAPQLLTQAQEDAGQPTRRTECEIKLGNQRLTVAVTDEQAAVNVNALSQTRSRASVRDAVRRLTSTPGTATGNPPQTRIRPQTSSFKTFAQVYDQPSPRQLWETRPELTCWGDGKLHWRRAAPDAIRAYLTPITGRLVPEQLVELREDETLTLTSAVELLEGVPDKTRDQLFRLLTDDSRCYGIWVRAQTQHRDWYSLQVLEEPSDREAPRRGGGASSSRGTLQPTIRLEW